MSKEPRPLLDSDDDQETQARMLGEPDAGASVENEGELLAALFGPPNAAGIYGALEGSDN